MRPTWLLLFAWVIVAACGNAQRDPRPPRGMTDESFAAPPPSKPRALPRMEHLRPLVLRLNDQGGCPDRYMLAQGHCVDTVDPPRNAQELEEAIDKVSGISSMRFDGKNERLYRARDDLAWRRPPEDADAVPPPKPGVVESLECENARETLARYERGGVLGKNPQTGVLERLTGDEADAVLHGARNDVRALCAPQ